MMRFSRFALAVKYLHALKMKNFRVRRELIRAKPTSVSLYHRQPYVNQSFSRELRHSPEQLKFHQAMKSHGGRLPWEHLPPTARHACSLPDHRRT